MLKIYLKTFLDYRQALFWWGLGLVGLVFMYVSLFPSIQSSSVDLSKYLEQLPEAFRSAIGNNDFTSATGYITGEIFSITGPLLFIIFAISLGSSSVAGEEEKGYLDVIFSYPVRRWEFVLAKAAILLTLVLSLAAILWLVLVIGSSWQNMGLSTQNLASAVIVMSSLALLFGSLALFIGASTGRKGVAIGVSSVLALGSYLINTLATSVKELKDWEFLSPFYYYDRTGLLEKGADLGNLILLLSVSMVFIILAIIFFQRRDISNG